MRANRDAGASPPPLAVALVSAGALALEVLLTRLFAIAQWNHLAFLVVSMALLGFGASGTWLTLSPPAAGSAPRARFARHAALFALATPVCALAALRLPFNALELVWDPRQLGWLTAVALLLAVPFFFAANALGIALAAGGERMARVYGANLLGAGAGAGGTAGLLFAARAEHALVAAAALGMAGALAALAGSPRRRLTLATLTVALGTAAAIAAPAHWPGVPMSPYKALSGALRTAGARLAEERSGPLGLVSAVENERVPLRHAPGLSLSGAPPAPQAGIYVDGDGPLAVTGFDGQPGGVAFLDAMTSALPYHLRSAPEVLVLGAGAGASVLQALVHGARHVDAVEVDPHVVGLVRGRYREFSGRLYARPDVSVHLADSRGFLARAARRWDVIQVAHVEDAGAAGLQGLSPSHLYTTEGIGTLLDRLAPGGVVSITRTLKLPPRDAPRLIATASAALRARGVADPGSRVAMIRSLGTTTVLVKDGPLAARDVADVRAFARRWSFDLVHLPGLEAREVNRHAHLASPVFHEAAAALLSPRAAEFTRAYKLDLRPATDDRPFFHSFLRVRHLPEVLALHARGGASLLEIGHLLLLACLAVATVLGAALIVVPLARVRRSAAGAGGVSTARVLACFALIGLAFLMVEMAFLQKLLLLLGHPLYAIALVLSAFLAFAGLGALHAGRTRRPPSAAVAIGWCVAAGLGLLVVLSTLETWVIGLPGPLRATAALTLIAPLAFCMGMPFPLALAALARAAPDLVPWAWGINGCASVVSAVVATVLGLEAGFTAVIAIALAIYALAAWASAFGGPGQGAAADAAPAPSDTTRQPERPELRSAC